MRLFLCLVGAATAALPALAQVTGVAASGECAAVPILHASVPVVEATIGGKGPYRFAIDTGTEGHGGIGARLAEELGLPKIGEADALAAGGEVARRPVFAAPEISVGDVSFKNLDLVALPDAQGPLAEWDGVLGNALLELLPLTLDYGNARVRFGGPQLQEGLPISFESGAPVLPLDIAGQRFKVPFDSGLGIGGLLLDEAAARELKLAGDPAVRGTAQTSAGDIRITEAPLAVSVTIDGKPLPVRAVGWPSPRAGGNLGSRAMVGMSVTIDSRAQLARVEPSGLPPRCPG